MISKKRKVRGPDTYIDGENPTATVVNRPDTNTTVKNMPKLKFLKALHKTSNIEISNTTYKRNGM
jgi:hypothetical protein